MSKCRWCSGSFKRTEAKQHYCNIDHKTKALNFTKWPNKPNDDDLKDLS